MGWLEDETGLKKCAANFAPLTPLSHLARAADIFADGTALVWKGTRRSYAEYRARVTQLASALAARGIRPGDVVATILPNVRTGRGAFRRAGLRRGSQYDQHPAGCRYHGLHLRASGREGRAGRHRLPAAGRGGDRRDGGHAPEIVEVADREAGFTPTGAYPEYEEDISGGGRPGVPLDHARRRMGKHRDQL